MRTQFHIGTQVAKIRRRIANGLVANRFDPLQAPARLFVEKPLYVDDT